MFMWHTSKHAVEVIAKSDERKRGLPSTPRMLSSATSAPTRCHRIGVRGDVFAATLALIVMMLRFATTCVCALALYSCSEGQAVNETVPSERAVHVTRQAEGYLFEENARSVLFYQLAPKSMNGEYERSNYVHPLYGLDGEVLTEDFPEDHLHHRGVYWAWHQVLIGDVRAGDPWMGKGFSWDLLESDVLASGDGVRARFHWKSPDFHAGEEPIIEETTTVRALPSEGDLQKIDFDIRLVPLHDNIRLGGSEDDKGYGGFSARFKILEDLTFVTADGVVSADRNAVDGGSWMDFSASFRQDGGKSGVAILVHPSSIGYPQPWIIRALPSKSMQNPLWPGPEPTPVTKGEEIVLRYRLVLHRGAADAIALTDLWDEYQQVD